MIVTTASAARDAGLTRRWAPHFRRSRQQLHPRLAPLLGLMGVSWLLIILANVTGNDHHFTHHQLHHPSLAALLGVLVAWQLMTVAMMGPSCLPAARYVAMNTLQPVRTVPMFLIGYLLLWSGFLIAVAISDTLLRSSMSTDDWLVQYPTTLLIGALLVAAAWQLTPLKRACLRSCRTGRVFPARGHRADLSTLYFGARHGLACLGSCGPMMLIMLTTSGWHLPGMIALTILIWFEKTRGTGRRLAVPTAITFAGLAALTFLLN